MDENTPVRYTVYCSLIKVAATCNAISFIPTDLDQVQQFKAHTHTTLLAQAFVGRRSKKHIDDPLLWCSLGAQVDYWLELNHREKTHTSEAGIWSTGRLQEKVTNRVGTNDQRVLLCRDCYGCNEAPEWKASNRTIFLDSEAAAKVMVELLGSYTEDNASQARVDAHRYTSVLLSSFVAALILKHIYSCVCFIFRCIVRALKDPNTFLMDHLLTLKPVRFLEGELIHDVSTEVQGGSLATFWFTL